MMQSKKESKEKLKKSIYSDDEDENEPKFEPPQKNFEGELKPGLNVSASSKLELFWPILCFIFSETNFGWYLNPGESREIARE